ncbi:uracil-DNA glycosylase [Rathayibacter sp. VKM Ac-2803]|nr:uracil-DNA glycosylase [Rathayibacter sp. VKM Ac-2803]
MFLPAPRGLADPAVVADRKALLASSPTVQPLVDWSRELVDRRSALSPERGENDVRTVVPHFDPAEAGIEARVLILMEAPGPMTNSSNRRPGSGFISADNDDQTAANCWNLRDEVGLTDHTLHWNIVPWYLGVASRKPTSRELEDGATELRGLLRLLTEVRVVVAAGLYAQKGWKRLPHGAVSSDMRVIDTWHPSPLALKQPGKRDELRRAFAEAADIAAE